MTPEQLKASILQMAIQGKLVEQRKEEGTAEEPYKQIQENIRNVVIKKFSVDDMIDGLFEIPETWKWVYLQDIVKKTIKRGKSPKYVDKSSIQVFAQKCNVKLGGINMQLARFLDEKVIGKYPDEEYIIDGDIVINSTGGGTMGRVGVFNDEDRIDDMKIVPDSHVTIVRACDDINSKYLYYFLKYNQSYFEKKGEGSTNQTELKPITIASLKLPLPPLDEQKRIVAKLEELLPFVERYAKSYEKLNELNEKFPEDMKKSILQYAIQGKLVEQRKEEGNAEELYKQIQEEKQRLIKEKKIKKEKPLEEIPEEEIPFDIPESWKWVRIGNVMLVKGGKRIPAGKKLVKDNTGHIYIRVSDMKNGTVCDSDIHYVPDDVYHLIKNYTISKDDVYITVAGTIGRIGIIPEEFDNANLTENADKLVFSMLEKKFVMYLMNSNIIQNQIKDITTKVGQPKLAIKRIENMIFPLPPLEEQKRIVAKIEELLPLCERLNSL